MHYFVTYSWSLAMHIGWYTIYSTVISTRTGSNDLRIDTGRNEWTHRDGKKVPLPPNERTCRCCLNATDDESHFMLDCPIFEPERAILRQEVDDILDKDPTQKGSQHTIHPTSPGQKTKALALLLGDTGLNHTTDNNIKSSAMKYISSAHHLKTRLETFLLHL